MKKTSGNVPKDTTLLTVRNIQFLMLILIMVFGFATYSIYTMLSPILLSSTSPISEINGDNNIAKVAEQFIEDKLLHPHPIESTAEQHHHHHAPKPQYDVKFRTSPNPAVKPLESIFRADTAMSVKFR